MNLTGTVPRYPQYLEAAAAARRVVGVSTVDNNLQVVLPESDYRDDAKLTTAANNALAANVTVPDNVEATEDDGNITLTGTVSYGTERGAADAAVSGLIGVRNVMNDIDISYGVDPVEVDLHVQQALDRSALAPDGSDVTADTKDGVITLTGHVRTWAEHDQLTSAEGPGHLVAQRAGRRLRPRLVLPVTGGGPDDHGRSGSARPGRAAPPVPLGQQVISIGLDEQLFEHRVHRGLLAVPGLRKDQLPPACPARGCLSVTGPTSPLSARRHLMTGCVGCRGPLPASVGSVVRGGAA